MPDGLSIELGVADDAVTLALTGEVDLATAPQLSAAFAEALTHAPNRVVIDCTALTFLDSSGIQVLVAAWEAMRDRATMPVVLKNMSPIVKQVLEACGVRDLLTE